MQIQPRYDGAPIISMPGQLADQLERTVRQRRRLEAMLDGLTDRQWLAQSRCDAWTVRDVVAHLNGVNAFWQLSIRAGVTGTPSRFLTQFDPVATPAAMVAATSEQSIVDVMAQFRATNADLIASLRALTDREWAKPAETPVGHLPIRLLAAHALWDGWIHERDIAVPLGITCPVEADELETCLRYAAALAAALALGSEIGKPARFAVDATDPPISFTFTIDEEVTLQHQFVADAAPSLRGPSVALIEALSLRAPLPDSAPVEWRRLLAGLSAVFDAADS